MGIKSKAAKLFAWWEVTRLEKLSSEPIITQEETFSDLLGNLAETQFGKEHFIQDVESSIEFREAVPLRDYEALKPWVEKVKSGEENVLWPGKPLYLCKTSGTTSGSKYIPMSEEGIKAQVRAARSALLHYIHETGKSDFTNGKMIFLQGSPALEDLNGMKVGRLSGIVAHHVPAYLQKNRMPSKAVNRMDDWEKKVDAIVDETLRKDMRLISGIPPWVQMYFERLIEKSGKSSIQEIFPNFSLFVHGGVNYAPYAPTLTKLIGRSIDTIETYPASEGFIAYQDSQQAEGMLLNLDAGIFYEFIPLSEIHNEKPTRLTLAQVEKNVNYAIVLNTSSGLWGYVIGDTVKFVSTEPYRLVVSGRIKHFISAFGEHVIAEEVESALGEVTAKLGVEILEFHVAPEVSPGDGLPYHEWFLETEAELSDDFKKALDEALCERNSYYRDLIEGKVLRMLEISKLPRGSFNRYMDSIGKLGGQNKLPRLSNDRKVANELKKLG